MSKDVFKRTKVALGIHIAMAEAQHPIYDAYIEKTQKRIDGVQSDYMRLSGEGGFVDPAKHWSKLCSIAGDCVLKTSKAPDTYCMAQGARATRLVTDLLGLSK